MSSLPAGGAASAGASLDLAELSRELRNSTFSTTILVRLRFCPVSLSSQRSSLSRPSTSTLEPLVRYSPQISACLPHASHSPQYVSSFLSPDALSVHLRVDATENLATAWPPGVYLTS